jgi:hypothetical protein
MTQAVKISDAEMNAIKAAAEVNQRSISDQAEHWIRLGRAVEQDPRFGHVQIQEALNGLRPPSSLTDEQQEAFLDEFEARLDNVSKAEAEFWEYRRRSGVGVGMDEDGNLIYGSTTRPS